MITVNVRVVPSEISGEVRAPPSKSYTHRALFLSLLAEGESRLVNPLISNDTEASMGAIREFGADASWERIIGVGDPVQPKDVIWCGNSGTTARISMAIAALVDGTTVIDGSASLRRRPMSPMIEALSQMGIEVEFSEGGRLPILVRGGRDKIKSRTLKVRGDVSSQFITALLIVAPKVGLEIEIISEPKSRPYLDITIKSMRRFGLSVHREDYRRFSVERQNPIPTTFKIPGDYSSAAFILAAGALHGKVRVRGLDPRDVQGDRMILDVLCQMGADVKIHGEVIEVSRGDLEGIHVNCSDAPDLVPVISVLGAYARGTTIISGADHLRYKESDRLRAIADNLKRMGVNVKEREDGLVIKGHRELRGAVLDSYGDHRIAMALVIAALGARGESKILGVDCVQDSYPAFFNDLMRIGGRVEFQ